MCLQSECGIRTGFSRANLGAPGGITRWKDVHIWLQVRLDPAWGKQPLFLSGPSLGAHSSIYLLGPCLSLCMFTRVSSFPPNTPQPSSFGVLLRPFPAGAAPSVASLNPPGSSQVKVFSPCGLLSPPLDRPSLRERLQCRVLDDECTGCGSAARFVRVLALASLVFGFPETKMGFLSFISALPTLSLGSLWW